MPDAVDVLIVGGGPGGLFLAARLAGEGVRTLVCEEHSGIGEPVHCTGVLSTDTFEHFDLPAGSTLNDLKTARFVSPGGIVVEYTTPTPVAAVIDRSQFDRALADRASAAGAELRSGSRVSAVDVHDSGVLVAVGADQIAARLVVLACGANYAFQRRLGLGLPRTYLHTAQRELPAAALRDVELHFGQEVAPEGFAWAVPVQRPDGPHVRVGAMTARDALQAYTRMLERVADRWGIDDRDAPPRQKILPLGVIDRTYGDRLLVIGDAAGLVKPTTGGGIYYSVLSARLAADVVVPALRADRLDARTLSAYESAWRSKLEEEFAAQQALREIAANLSDGAIDSLFELAHSDGIMPIVRATARFNEHRPLIRALFNHPPARKILFRAFVA